MVSAYSIGTAKRQTQQQTYSPGPLAYIPKKCPKVQPPEWSFGKGNRIWRSSSEGPGPGTYE